MLIVARSPRPAGEADRLRAIVHGIDPEVAVLENSAVTAMAPNLVLLRAVAAVTFSLGLLALSISMLGVYGVVSFFVSTRVREFGIRVALGATRQSLLKLVLDHAIRVALYGLLPGVFISAVGSRLGQFSLAFLPPGREMTWYLVPVLILLSAVVSAFAPARRASRVDPNVALRHL